MLLERKANSNLLSKTKGQNVLVCDSQEKHAISSHLHTIQESNADSFSPQKTKRRNQFGISFSLIHWHENTRFVRLVRF